VANAVKTALRYRLFHYGKMPTALAAVRSGPDVLVAAEGISIKSSSRSVRLPGLRSGRGVSLLVGSIVLTPRRLIAAVGPYEILDSDFTAAGGEGQTLALSADGVRIALEVESVLDGGKGSVELHYRMTLEETVLAQLPSIKISIALSDAVAPMLRSWV
jgi:hypothetical protein